MEHVATTVANWVSYLTMRIDAGYLRPLSYVSVAARLIIETAAWFCMHRYGDYDGARFNRQRVHETVAEMLFASLTLPVQPGT